MPLLNWKRYMILSPLDHLVAATLAGAKAAACNLDTREEYLAEYEEFLRLMATRARPECREFNISAICEASEHSDDRHIPSTI